MSKTRDNLQSGLLQGRLPGMKEWRQYYLVLTSSQLHIYEGMEYGEPAGQHLRSLQIHSSDIAGMDSKNKKENRFYILRVDGRYIFKCPYPQEREEWITQLQRVISKQTLERMPDFKVPSPDEFDPDNLRHSPLTPRRVDVPQPPSAHKSRTLPSNKRSKSVSGSKLSSVLDTPLPRPPVEPLDSPRASIVSDDSGIGVSGGGEIHMPPPHQRAGSSSVPSSGDAQFGRRAYGAGSSKSDGGKFGRNQIQVDDSPGEFSYEKCKWYWGYMSRTDCEEKMKSEGSVGNFVVRMNANGHYVMSLWRTNGVHHHKIIRHDNLFRFERSQVSSEGESLVDLLDTYMKNTKDKGIKPFGGALYDQYTYAWNPPDFDMLLLQERLKEQKRKREMAKTPPSNKKNQYTPVELDLGKGHISTDSESSGDTTFVKKKSPPPKPPVKPMKPPSSNDLFKRAPPVAEKERSESPLEKSKRFKVVSPDHAASDVNARELQPPVVSPSAASHVKRSPSQPRTKPTGHDLISEMVKKRNTPKDSPPPPASKPKKQPIPLPKPKPNKKSTPTHQPPSTQPPQTEIETESSLSPPPQQQQTQEPAYSNWEYTVGTSGTDKEKPTQSKPYQNWTTGSTPPPSKNNKRYQNVIPPTAGSSVAMATPPSTTSGREEPHQVQQQQPQEETVYMNLQGPEVKTSRARHRARQQQQSATQNGHRQAGSEYQNIGKGYR